MLPSLLFNNVSSSYATRLPERKIFIPLGLFRSASSLN